MNLSAITLRQARHVKALKSACGSCGSVLVSDGSLFEQLFRDTASGRVFGEVRLDKYEIAGDGKAVTWNKDRWECSSCAEGVVDAAPEENCPPLFPIDPSSSAFQDTLLETPRVSCVIPQCTQKGNGHAMSRCPTRKMVSRKTYYARSGRLEQNDSRFFAAAGVAPFATSREDSKVYMLLAEQYKSDRKTMLHWIGGKREAHFDADNKVSGAETPVQTAWRETTEEILGKPLFDYGALGKSGAAYFHSMKYVALPVRFESLAALHSFASETNERLAAAQFREIAAVHVVSDLDAAVAGLKAPHPRSRDIMRCVKQLQGWLRDKELAKNDDDLVNAMAKAKI